MNEILYLLTSVAALIGIWLLLRGLTYSLKFFEALARGQELGSFQKKSHCSRCNRRIPFFSRRRSLGEMVFGGWTCPKCGSEFDQLGDIRLARARDAHLRDFKKRDRVKLKVEREKDTRTHVERVIDE